MIRIVFLVSLMAASTALAHEGVKNPAVQARMHGMKELGAATKILGEMAKGVQSFDASAADAAMQKIREETARIEGLFEANEDDPKSEALPGIWTDFADFSVKTQALTEAVSADVSSLEDVKAIVPKIGATCSACHKVYRQK